MASADSSEDLPSLCGKRPITDVVASETDERVSSQKRLMIFSFLVDCSVAFMCKLAIVASSLSMRKVIDA